MSSPLFRGLFRHTVLILIVAGMVSCSTSNIVQLPSKNQGERIKTLVIHYTALNYADSVKALVDEGGLSAHYLVPESGDPTYPHDRLKVMQLVDESRRAWHAGISSWQGRSGLNDQSIGIEVVNVPDCHWETDVPGQHSVHGASRPCLFPDYDSEQITLLTTLIRNILARNPDIHPTAIVGHADIAFNRKSDPGPRFPWYQLYQAGIGAWYDKDTLDTYWQTFAARPVSVSLFQQALARYGYGVLETGQLDEQTINAISAFQMHFLPWQVSGRPDAQTSAALFALLDKYFPQQAEIMLSRYQREADAGRPAQITRKQGQIDRHFPGVSHSDLHALNNKARFKAYRGRGDIVIEASEDVSATVHVNGEALNIADVLFAHTPYAYSLARRTHDGINTLSVSDVYPDNGSVHVTVPYPVLTDNSAAYTHTFREVDKQIQHDVDNGFPGAVLLVIKDGEIIKHDAYGYALRYDENQQPLEHPLPMTTTTEFDLASNTKMFATTLALMTLVADGKLDVSEPLHTYIPEYRGGGRETRRVIDLLSHQSGYAPEVKFFTPDNELGADFYSLDKTRTTELLLQHVPFMSSRAAQTLYSDTNFMLLGLLVERITGMTLDAYCESQIYGPLGLTHTRFTPLLKGAEKSAFAATEINGNTRNGTIDFPGIRTTTLQGEVHDEKAYYAMDGVSGHAGLFSTAGELAVLVQALINRGGYGDVHLFDGDIMQSFISPGPDSYAYGLGWKRAGNGESVWHFGPYASDSAFGHTGWTGTVTVIDPELDMGIILLTNARHSPIRQDNAGPPVFSGTQFDTGRYGQIVTLVYEAVLHHQSK
ncbi:penicillin binding protein PBP4B [Alteromonas sp. H39]|uniref:penicillin binding protein PBP4B n=1 Tax=Alteromonas sp. H39 TaxID=3389876 RepID=UPI0039E1DC80